MVLNATPFRNIRRTAISIILLSVVLHTSGQDAKELHRRGEYHCIRGEYTLADSLFSESLVMRKHLADTLSAGYAETLHAWGKMKFYQEDRTKAKCLLQQAANIRTEILDTNHPDYIETLLFQGANTMHGADIEAGENLLNEALRLLPQANGDTLRLHGEFMYYLGYSQLLKRDLVSANTYYTRAMEHERKHFGENTIEFARCLNCLSIVRMNLGQFHDVEAPLLEALDIYRRNNLENHPDNLGLYINLSAFYMATAQYHRVSEMLPNVLKDIERIQGKENSYYVNSLNILAISYQYLGLYEQAEAAFLESLELRQKMYGEESRQVTILSNNIASLYYEIGNYDASTNVYKKALDIAHKHNYKDLYGLIYGGLGQNLSAKGDLNEALDYLNKALEMQKQYANTGDLNYLTLLGEWMRVKGGLVQEESDEEEFINTLNLSKKRFGKFSNQYVALLNTTGMFYSGLGRNKEAADYFREALDILPKLKGSKNELQKHSLLHNLGQCYDRMNNTESSIACCFEAVEAVKSETKRTFVFLAEKEREAFIQSRMKTIQQCKNLLIRYKDTNPNVTAWLYNNELFYKNLLLSSSIQIQHSIQAGENNDLTTQWNELRTLKDKLIRINREKVRGTYIDSLENHCWQLEKYLVKESKAYREEQLLYDLTWQDIKDGLGKGQFMVDYVWTYDWRTSEVTYDAMILGADFGEPVIVSCCKESELEAAMDAQDMDAVYRLVWEPVARTLGSEADEVCIVPTRLLYRVSFNGLKDRHGMYLIDKYLVRNMLSARNLVNLAGQKQEKKSTKSIVLFGGADYDLSVPDYLALHSSDTELRRGQGFHYLPGSKAEVQTIGKILSDSKWKVTVFTDTDATEARVKSYSGASPNVLHISTHGFYFSDSDESKKKNNSVGLDSPLLRTGLVFTGANATWNNGTEALAGEVEDGILSAYEVANLDLSNTQLVVLSACNTGRGDFRVGSEGLYGLQRAFLLAGVQSLVISLWEISDTDTVTFMSEFYQEWNNGNTPAEAFVLAQKKMKNMFPDDTDKWSAFVFIE